MRMYWESEEAPNVIGVVKDVTHDGSKIKKVYYIACRDVPAGTEMVLADSSELRMWPA